MLNDQLADIAFITEFIDLNNNEFYKLIPEGLFSKPIKLDKSARGLQSEVKSWVQQRIY
ncbi:Rha family transcriptional regulator [Yersinia intermedia]|nr:Rha family transcriptional regulator [Yersinia intermedia]